MTRWEKAQLLFRGLYLILKCILRCTMGGWNGGLDVLESVYSKIILTELGTGCRGIHCKILSAFLACLKMFIINVRINLLKWKMQFAAIWMENNCDLSPFVTRGYFAYLLQDSIKILCRSLCNRAWFIKFRRVLPSFLIHLYHLDTFGLVFSSHNSLSPTLNMNSQGCVSVSTNSMEWFHNHVHCLENKKTNK